MVTLYCPFCEVAQSFFVPLVPHIFKKTIPISIITIVLLVLLSVAAVVVVIAFLKVSLSFGL